MDWKNDISYWFDHGENVLGINSLMEPIPLQVYWWFEISVLLFLTSNHNKVKEQSVQIFTDIWRENSWIHIFLKSISAMWNANSLIQAFYPVGLGSKIHRLHLCRGVRPPNKCPDMTLNNLMVKLRWCWSFGECRGPLHCQVHNGPEW